MNKPNPEGIVSKSPDQAPAARILWRSLQVLRLHPRLALFPALTAVACVGMFAVFYGTTILRVWSWAMAHHQPATLPATNPHAWAIAAFYFSTMFAATFFNTAFYHEVMRVFAGESPCLGRGLRFAAGRIGPIATWSVFAWSIGMIIRVVSERLGWVSRLIGGAAGFAWSVSAVFAIPVLIRDNTFNPLTVLRDSSATVRRTWGSLVYGFLSFSVFTLVGFVLVGAAVSAGTVVLRAPTIFVPLAAILVLVYFVVIVAAKDVYRCALYIYATEGVVPGPFLPGDMDAAWRIRGGGSASSHRGDSSPESAEDAYSPRANLWARIWKWILVAAGTVWVAVLVGMVVLVSILSHHLHGLPVYRGAVARVESSPAVAKVLGSSVKEGWFFTGTISFADTSDSVDFNFPISGPRGSATVELQASRVHGQWHYNHMVVQPGDGSTPIDLSEPMAPQP